MDQPRTDNGLFTSDQTIEAENDAKLAEILGMETVPGAAPVMAQEPSEAIVEALGGDKVEAETDKQITPEETPVVEPQEVAESGSKAADDPKFTRARDALLRSGMLESELTTLTPDDVLGRGLKRAEVLARDDNAYRLLREFEAKNKEEPSPETETKTEQPSAQSVKAQLQPLVEALGLDDGAEGPLVEVIAGLSSRLERVEAAEKTLQQLQAHVTKSAEQSERDILSASRERLKERFLELGDDGRSQELADRMRLLASDQSFRDDATPLSDRMDNLMSASARSLGYRETMVEAPISTNGDSNRTKVNGTPPASTQALNTPISPLSEDERSDMVLNMIAEGKTETEILKVVGRF